jgi:acetyl-CoA carboxylase biotin carboxyl carrier protein
MSTEKNTPAAWLKRVEDIINVLDGSGISEFELTERGTEIIIRRNSGVVMMEDAAPVQNVLMQAGTKTSGTGRASRADQTIPLVAPLTGIYYSAASPTTPPFVSIGDVVQAGQVVALVEAMKIFNEITADVTGRVVALVATNGAVVQKGDVLLRLEAI